MSTVEKSKVARVLYGCSVIAMFSGVVLSAQPAVAQDSLGVGDGAVFRLTDKSEYQEGCFEPCMCPIMAVQNMRGVMRLTYDASSDGVAVYRVHDVQIFVPRTDLPITFRGAGVYSIGSPSPATVIQQRLELDLTRDDADATADPIHFDSGWVPLQQSGRINITVSINNMYCYDTVLVIDADRVPDADIVPYALQPGSTFQRGCWDPCDCPIYQPLPMSGTFDLVPLSLTGTFDQYVVVHADWHVATDNAQTSWIPIEGFGLYTRFSEVAVQQRMLMAMTVGDEAPALFDSGSVVTADQFPLIDVLMSINGLNCFDTALHVIAAPANGAVCGGIAGIPCNAGEFCNLPVGHCCCDFFGQCTMIPEICIDLWDPVCGCDGNTYGNECEAAVAQVSLAHYGACEQVCASDVDCDQTTQFCKFPDGHCNQQNSGGVCVDKPVNGCPDIYDPVCGCDGVTYSNECESDAVGVSVAYRGACSNLCGRATDPPCPDYEYCRYPIGTCGATSEPGVCTPRYPPCQPIYDPVCGCDGVTYFNECAAGAAAVSVLYMGECVSPDCPARRSFAISDAATDVSIFCPGHSQRVRIVLNVPAGTSAISLEDTPPAGWAVSDISNEGTFDATNGKVKWGPFFPPFPAEVSYAVMPVSPDTAPSCFDGQISMDGTDVAVCGEQCLHEGCPPWIAADAPGVACPQCGDSDCSACGPNECGNNRVTLCELVANACSWQAGCHDDMSQMTRAAYIWRNGECYCWDDASAIWQSTACPAPGSGLCSDATASATSVDSSPVSVDAFWRPSRTATSRGTMDVTISPNVPANASAVAVELAIPIGWQVVSVDADGHWDSTNRKVKWGLFMDAVPSTLELTLAPTTRTPAAARGARKQPGTTAVTLQGTISIDGHNSAFAVR